MTAAKLDSGSWGQIVQHSTLPLALRIAPRLALPGSKSVSSPGGRSVPIHLANAVNARDLFTCRFCGFKSRKYQTAVALDPRPVDLSAIVTACVFCAQCMDLEQIPAARSATVIWLPEVSQVDLVRALHPLYALRLRKETGDRTRRILDALASNTAAPRTMAANVLGDEPVKGLIARVRSGSLSDEEAASLRLFNLDRLIVREGDLEFNKFPQILAYWRSKDGPLRDLSAAPDFDRLEQALQGRLSAIAA